MTRESIKSLIQALAVDSWNITFVNECAGGEWESLVNHRQMLECLQHGDVLSDPWWDEDSKTHRCSMGYFHAGQDIVLEVAIEEKQKLHVVNVCQ